MNTFALIMLDYAMPHNGLETLKDIKELYKIAKTPMPRTVILSAYIDDDLKRKAKAHGVHDFVHKPLTNTRLRKICEELNIIPSV